MTMIDHLLKLRQTRQDTADTLKAKYSFEAKITYDNAARAFEYALNVAAEDLLKLVEAHLEVLDECAEHLDKYADFERDGYGGMEPNKAARLLYDVQCAINEAEGGGPALPR
jgi:hypothetical protein